MTSSMSLEHLVGADEEEVDLGVDRPLQDVLYNHSYKQDHHDQDVTAYVVQDVADQDDADQTDPSLIYQINRPMYTERGFHTEYKENEFEYVPCRQKIETMVKKCRCGSRCCKGCMVSTAPILGWLPRYVIRTQLLADIVSGITVCVMNIPQGMAYAMLASLPPVHGLYLGFFAPIIYALTGTSKQLAMGTYSVLSILVGTAIESAVPLYPDDMEEPPTNGMYFNNTEATAIPEWDRQQELIDAAIILALLVGIIQLSMGILRLGWVTVYLSDPFIKGYTTGSGVHVFTSQIDNILGVKVGSYDGLVKLYYVYRDIFTGIEEWNCVTILLSISCILVLIFIKEVESKFKKHLHGFPLGGELVVVILGTLSSYFLNLEANHNVDVVGEIPAGLPAPSLQSTKYLTSMIGSAFPIAIVSYSIAVAMASLFAQKKNYEIDANQIAGLVNSALMLVVLLWIGPLFETLPTAVLASIIIVALRGIFRQLLDLPTLYKYDVIDFGDIKSDIPPQAVWCVSCLAVILSNVDIGLLIGVGFTIFAHVWRTQRPHCTLLGRIPGTDLYKDIKWYSSAREIPGIKIFCMQASLYYANVAHFKSKVYKLTGLNPKKTFQLKSRQQQYENSGKKGIKESENKIAHVNESEQKYTPSQKAERSRQLSTPAIDHLINIDRKTSKDDGEHGDHVTKFEDIQSPGCNIHTIIIDCSPVSFIDSTGLNGLRQLVNEFRQVDITVLLTHCRKSVRDFLSKGNFHEKVGSKGESCIFVTIHDAVLYSTAEVFKAKAKEKKIHSMTRNANMTTPASTTVNSYQPENADVQMTKL
uniref:Pendrin-like n=1 Tax=Saccoglossus kowalevskii TaxID=10224 RepID=A0ABM0MLV7_SACKO|nr:PREDICTED: pendrin-like [Saccoglossus kowalevskii]